MFRNLRKALPWAAEMGLRHHDLRHVIAGVVEQNYSFAIAAAMLGHSLPETTGTYARPAERDVRRVHDELWAHLNDGGRS